ncbi:MULTISPECIES: LuxR C-terminal-related transcriptional regulator [Nocardioides]|uniref:LuxR C-terminal-related transcriptional regulator n=1 Tax=Nocardioides vastitatis TaxID=2568655 RepID=A0ABW0ZSA3_9ACTN|nr:LuxR C-terminal-related transcriptional regulator [Nocardioides sp.]THI94383.1 helix-turn-helix transcriptional regulator [Nocardioides sp.]
MATIDHLASGRAAAEVGHWDEARAAFAASAAVDESADALDGLGRACWWLGDVRSAIRHRGRAFTLLRQAGRDDEAAMVALDLCVWHLTNLENDAAARGWFARAARAAEHTTTPDVRGWLVLIGAYLSTDLREQRQRLEEARRLALEASDDGLYAMALADLGLLLVAAGEVVDGMALLDEAMATTLGGYDGRLEVVVWSSCTMLAACSLVDDLRRATQWCRAAEEFTQTYGCPFLQARCRAHYGSVLVAAGRWGLAEPELRRALSMSEDVGHQPLVEARTALAALRLRQGRMTEAAELVEGLDTSVPDAALVAAEVRLAENRPDEAGALLRAALALLDANDPRGDLLVAILSEACLAAGDVTGAKAVLIGRRGDLPRTALPRGSAHLARATGLVAASAGDVTSAVRELADALAAFERHDLPFEAARTRLDLARTIAALDPEAAAGHAAGALDELRRLGAADQAAAAAALLRALGVTPRPAPRDPGVLTRREQDVLALVADGLTNPEIAERLFLSRRTVAHHVSSILTKLALRSRAEAAAYAARTQRER